MPRTAAIITKVLPIQKKAPIASVTTQSATLRGFGRCEEAPSAGALYGFCSMPRNIQRLEGAWQAMASNLAART